LHRRHFTSEKKLAIVLKCERPGASVSAVARACQLATTALFRWRAEFGYGRKEKIKLASVQVAGERLDSLSSDDSATTVLHDLIPKPEGMTAVELPDESSHRSGAIRSNSSRPNSGRSWNWSGFGGAEKV
jgi:transposase-like protein